MIVRIIHVQVKQEYRNEFETATQKNHEDSIREPGILRFDLVRDTDNPGHYVLYEVYTSEAATTSHKETAHYAEWKQAVEPMMSAPRESASFEAVIPSSPKGWESP
ncbi:MAG: antibiotic biosynthesis monooxygenase [Spirochaetales bacterium]|nr:antibiotic biosynthesis monooxygenase [Spirochaetales bacterium]MCF7939041.1 antibiotic biosynthesis monooxygenase [Spirochaetales bacterium]